MARWDPELYLKFQAERTRPAWDLALRAKTLLEVPSGRREGPLRILDLGCGPGNSTGVLAQCFPEAQLTGLDSSPQMIEQAKKGETRARWILADAATWEPEETFDLIFSNAAIQWLPELSPLMVRMGNWLAPEGLLAVQIPANGAQALHREMKVVAASAEWAGFFKGFKDPLHYREPGEIWDALQGLGERDIWETTYWHSLRSIEDLVEWYSGTGMGPWLQHLTHNETRQNFRKDVLSAVEPHYPPRADGSVPFPFRRIFFTAAKKAAKP